MAENNEAVFGEVIEASLDLSKFQQDLDSMVEMYQAAMSKLGDNAPGVISTASLSNFSIEIGKLSQDVRDFVTATQDALSSVIAQAADAAAGTGKAVKRSKPTSDDEGSPDVPSKFQRNLAIDQEGEINRIAALKEKEQAADDALFKRTQEQTEQMVLARQEAEERIYEAAANEVAKELELKEKSAARQKALAEEIALEQESLANRYNDAQQRGSMRSRVSAIQGSYNSANSSLEEALKGASSKHGGSTLGAEGQQAADTASAAVRQLNEAMQQARQAAKDLDESLLQSAEAAAQTAAEAARINTALVEAGSHSLESTLRRGASTAKSLITMVLEYGVAWNAVNAVITKVEEAVMLPIKALEQGVEYLNTMEEKADALAGVLNSSYKFSNDMAEQLKLSEEAATGVVTQLRQISAAKNLNFDSLFNGFRTLANSGAGQMVGDMQQLVTLSEMFATAVKAARGDQNTQRLIMSQIPNLMSGQVTGINAILQALGLTNEQWQKIQHTALEHHNLVQLLSPSMEKYEQTLQGATGHQTELTAQLKLMVNEAEAHFAKGVWQEWTNILSITVDKLSNNRDIVDKLAELWGSVVTEALRFGEALTGVDTKTKSIGDEWGTVAIMLGKAAYQAEEFFHGLTLAYHILQDIGRSGMPKWMGGDGFLNTQKSFDDAKKQLADYEAEREASIKRLKAFEDEVYGKSKPGAGNAPLPNGEPTRNPPHKDKKGANEAGQELAEDRSIMENQIANANQVKTAKIDNAQYEFAQRRINEQQLHDQTMAALHEELVAIEQIVDAYEKKVRGIAGLKPGQSNTAINQAETLLTNNETHDLQGESRADDKLAGSNQQLAIQQMRAKGAEAEREAQKEIANAKLKGATEEQIAQMEAAAHRQAAQQEEALLRAQISQIAAAAHERTQLETTLQNELTKASQQGEADRSNLINASIKDRLRAEQVAYKERADTQESQLKDRESTVGSQGTKAQRQALSDLAAEYAVTTEQQAIYLRNLLAEAKATGADASVVNELTQALSNQDKIKNSALNQANKEQRNANKGAQGGLASFLFGDHATGFSDFGKEYNPQTDSYQAPDRSENPSDSSFAQSIKQLNHSLDNFSKATDNIVQGFSHGNNLEGAAAATSTFGQVATAASNTSSITGAIGQTASGVLGALGPMAGLAGGVMSLFSQIFTAEAQHIADGIKKAFDQTVTAYQNGAATLTQTMQQVEDQRQQAISQLSGRKGGQEQLKSLLPTLDQEIASLQNQQRQTIEQFTQSVADMRENGGLQNGPLSSMLDSWVSINEEVQKYISAGGDAQTAQEALSLTLKQIQAQAYNSLTQGQQQAVSDALTLNGLLQQRIQLENQFQQSTQQLLGQDSIQRRASAGVSAGMQIQQNTAAYQLQLQQLNSQISLGETKLDLERQVFDVATSTADLEAQQNADNIASLKTQLETLKQYAAIYSGIYQNPSGSYAMSNNLSSTIGSVSIQIDGSNLTAAQLTDAISSSLSKVSRYGAGGSYAQFNNG